MLQVPTHAILKANIFAAAALVLLVLSMGCAEYGQFPVMSPSEMNLRTGINDPFVPLPPDNSDPSSPSYKMVPLAWETSEHPERTLWSQYLQKIILQDWNSLLTGANDITNFCPSYENLDNNQKTNVWAQLFVAVTKYESNYDPTSRMQEPSMGTDPVTGKSVYSEGLLQLSYQDSEWATWCKFDWSKDKYLSPTDPRKTILNPYTNLACGVGIMAKQIENKGNIVVSSGVYWAVLKSEGMYNQISDIQAIVKSLSLCK